MGEQARDHPMAVKLDDLNLPDEAVLELGRYGQFYVGDLGYTSTAQKERAFGRNVAKELHAIFKSAYDEATGRGLVGAQIKAEARRVRPEPLPAWMAKQC